MTESVREKSDRLLTTGSVRITWTSPGLVMAIVNGDTDNYVVELHSGRWTCTCPARTDHCSHLRAVWLVTAPANVLQLVGS